MKTSMSRFQIHDDLTAPEGSVPVLRGADKKPLKTLVARYNELVVLARERRPAE